MKIRQRILSFVLSAAMVVTGITLPAKETYAAANQVTGTVVNTASQTTGGTKRQWS